jgi:hypothetical protein
MTQWYAVRGLDALAPNALYTVYESEPVDAARFDAMQQRAEMAEVALTAFVVAVDRYGKACQEYGARGCAAPDFAVWYMRFVELQRQEAQP